VTHLRIALPTGVRSIWPADAMSDVPRLIGVVGMLLWALAAVAAPLITPYDPTKLGSAIPLLPPTAAHIFGTDQLGRDLFTRVIYGARIDLQIGLIGVAIPLTTGTLIGLLAGYRGGLLDALFGRIVDIVTAFPFVVLVIAIVAMLGPGLVNLYIAISAVSWVAYARIVRGETLLQKNREFTLAARALGYRDARIMLRHLLPNVIAPAIVFSVSDFALDVLLGASVGFFGLGVQSPTPEWGVMIAEGRTFILTSSWVVVFPGLAIVSVGFFMGLIGDSLADAIRRVGPRK